MSGTAVPKNRRERQAARLARLKEWESRRIGGEYRTFRLTATQNTLTALATMPDPPNLHRLPGFFIVEEMDGKRYIENGLESPDAMTLRLEL